MSSLSACSDAAARAFGSRRKATVVFAGAAGLLLPLSRARPPSAATSAHTSINTRSMSTARVIPSAAASAAPAATTPPPSRRRRRLDARATPPSASDRQKQARPEEQEEGALAALEQAVERAASALDEMLQQVLQECVAEQAASFIRAPGGGGDGGDRSGDGADNGDNADGSSGSGSGWPSADTLEGIVRGAVAQRVEWLDDAFLAALDAYAEAIGGRMQSSSSSSGSLGSNSNSGSSSSSSRRAAAAATIEAREMDARLVEVLQRIRREVLSQVGARLPATVRVLDAALREREAPARLAVVGRALDGGGGGLPGVSFEALASTAGQLVDDMEDAEAVPDRALLARLVLLREELRAMHARRSYFGGVAGGGGGEAGGGNGGGNGGGGGAAVFGFHRSSLPRACAAFAKELLGVGDGARRAALLTKAFEEDWTGGAGKGAAGAGGGAGGGGAGGGSGGGGQGAAAGQKQQQQKASSSATKKEAPDVVRPGRFLATVHAMSGELEARLREGGAGGGAGGRSSDGDSGGGGSVSPEAATAAAVLRRLDEVRMEAVAVLDRMQRAGGGTASR